MPDRFLNGARNEIVASEYFRVVTVGTSAVELVRYFSFRTGDLQNLCDELTLPSFRLGVDRNDRYPEVRRKLRDIDLVFSFFENIDHRQRDHDGNAELEKLCCEIEVALEVRRVDDRNDHGGAGGARNRCGEDVACD